MALNFVAVLLVFFTVSAFGQQAGNILLLLPDTASIETKISQTNINSFQYRGPSSHRQFIIDYMQFAPGQPYSH